jgi:hypothetical protein
MAKKNNQKITIEDVEYDMNKLSDNAKSHVQNIQFVDSRLQQLHNELAISDTARIGYTRALKNELQK